MMLPGHCDRGAAASAPWFVWAVWLAAGWTRAAISGAARAPASRSAVSVRFVQRGMRVRGRMMMRSFHRVGGARAQVSRRRSRLLAEGPSGELHAGELHGAPPLRLGSVAWEGKYAGSAR